MVKQLNNKKWTVDFYEYSKEMEDKVRIRRGSFVRKKDAKKAERLWRNQLLDGTYYVNLQQAKQKTVPEVEPGISELWKQYLDKKTRLNLKKSTIQSYISIYSAHFQSIFEGVSLDDIDEEFVEDVSMELEAKGKTPKTCNNVLSALNNFISFLVDKGLLDNKPEIEWRKVDRKGGRRLTQDEQKTILEAINPKFYLLVYLALKTGMRLGETLALEWRDIDFDNKCIRVNKGWVLKEYTSTKNRRERTIPLSAKTIAILKQHRHNRKNIFSEPELDENEDEVIFTKRAVGYWLKKAREKSGLQHFRWHDLRHTFASELASANVNANLIREILGHRDLKTTQRYLHVDNREAFAAIESLDEEDDEDESLEALPEHD